MKRMLSLRKVVLLLIFIFVCLGFSKAKVTIDGNINVRIGNSSNNRNSNKTKSVGNIDDSGYLYKPFVINNKQYMLVEDKFNNKYIIQTVFFNNNPSNGIYSENAFLLKRHTNNCLSIDGDDDYCFTITSRGIPALYNRAEARYQFYGYFVKKYNKYRPGTFYNEEFYDEDFY